MRLLYKIAIRNLLRHKGRSLSIGFVLVVGAFFMTMGNGIVAGMKNGIDRNLIKALFGDITLMSSERVQDSVSGRTDVLDFMENYESVQKTVTAHEYVDGITPVVFGKAATLDLAMTQSLSTGIEVIGFWGVDFDRYKSVYSRSVDIIEGSHLKEGERGILINTSLRESLYSLHDVWLLPEGGRPQKDALPADALSRIENLITRNDLVLLGLNGSPTATDVRVPIKGIFKFKQMNEVLALINDADINLVDISTARDCMGFVNPKERISDLSEGDQILLSMVETDPDNLFNDNNTLTGELSDETFADYAGLLKRNPEKRNFDTDAGRIYNISQVNLGPGTDLDQAIEEINNSFIDSGLGKYVRAVSWKDAWVEFSGILTRTQLVFTLSINLIFLAAILMIANALSIAAMERTAEIGTMRTVGSRKGFIMGMFVMETSLLSLFFGGSGILLGIATIKLLAGMNLTTTQPVLQMLYGASQFSPSMGFDGVVRGIIQLGVVTAIAAVYPVIVARNIKPIDATRSC